jgi:hypothetical protein
MIFKRKKQRIIRPGDFVVLKPSIQIELLNKSYKTSKLTRIITQEVGVYEHDLVKTNTLKVEHCALFYVHSLSSFGNKFLNLKVLAVKNTAGSVGTRIRIHNQKNNFIVTQNSIDLFTGDAYYLTKELNNNSIYSTNIIWNDLDLKNG